MPSWAFFELLYADARISSLSGSLPTSPRLQSRSRRRFARTFAEWAVNSSEEDYGWDYIVERFNGGSSTGLLFSAQLKSSINTSYSGVGEQWGRKSG
jgi:hypothetical protein